MDRDELAFAGIARQAQLVREREVSARELVELYLERIERLDPKLNAFRVVLGERALAEADQAQARVGGDSMPPLLGVPIAIKDHVDVAGEVTTHGTCAYGEPAGRDAEVVRRLRAAGAVVIGKTHLPELAICAFTESATWGPTRNPWDPERTPGGSSGGSAAAVAAGLIGAAEASDGAGSIRIPSACCGLFGLKPQRGRISLMPDPEHWHGLSVIGAVTRRVLDSAIFCDATMGGAAGDASTPPAPHKPFADAARTPPGKLRIAISLKAPIPTRLDDEVAGAVHATADLLGSLGHQVRERDPDYGNVANMVTARYLRGIHDDVGRMPYPDLLEPRTRGFGRLGELVSREAIRHARAAEPGHARRINRLFEDHDVLVTPVTATPPVEVGRWEGRGAVRTLVGMANGFAPFPGTWNGTGQPAASVPAGISAAGLPLAVQLVGRPNDEPTLISLAAQLESERRWPDERPPLGRAARAAAREPAAAGR